MLQTIVINSILCSVSAYVVCDLFQMFRGIGHGDARSNCFQHFDVIVAIPKSDCLFRIQVVISQHSLDCSPFSAICRNNIDRPIPPRCYFGMGNVFHDQWIWSLITTTPQEFRGGDIWNAIVGINEGLKAVGYGLLVLFFAMGIFQSAASFRDLQRPEYALRHFIRFIAAKVAVSSAMEIMTVVFSICGGIVQSVMSGVGGMVSAGVTVPQEMVDAIENVGFLASIPLWLVAMLGNLFVTVMSFILIMTVYGRFFRIYIFTALAPIPLASFAGEGTSFAGKAFIKSYIGVCMEGVVIVLACMIFSAFASTSGTVLDTSLSAVTMSWQYVGETIFNMLVLVGLVKGAERIVREMFGL